MTDTGDATAPFFGFIGAAAALVFSSMGAAYGTAKSGVGIAAMGVMRPELVMKSIVPVVMAGVLGIYGFIISVLIAQKVAPTVRIACLGTAPLPPPPPSAPFRVRAGTRCLAPRGLFAHTVQTLPFLLYLCCSRATGCAGLQDVRRVRPPGLGLGLRLERS